MRILQIVAEREMEVENIRRSTSSAAEEAATWRERHMALNATLDLTTKEVRAPSSVLTGSQCRYEPRVAEWLYRHHQQPPFSRRFICSYICSIIFSI